MATDVADEEGTTGSGGVGRSEQWQMRLGGERRQHAGSHYGRGNPPALYALSATFYAAPDEIVDLNADGTTAAGAASTS